MAEHNRLGMLEGVCVKFAELVSAGRGEVEMVVVSAQVRGFPSLLSCLDYPLYSP